MDRSIAIGLVSFAVTASVLAIPSIADAREGRAGAEPMTRTAVETRVAERFAAADADSSGGVTREEAAAHRDVRRAERQDSRFARMDGDGDGVITIAERDAARAERMQRRGIRRSDMIAEVSDMRGRLTAEELADLGPNAELAEPPARDERRAEHRAAHMERRNQAWTAADTDNDGALSRAEFDTLHAGRTHHRGQRHTGRFDRMDADNNGEISLAEMSERAMARFDRADADGDGTVTAEERRAMRHARHSRRR
ncbi:hypothetical protein HFP51_10570 [Parasphingopyxis sp. CP4]|uniref:hypothetical protein n=1 Tax=Parasphingopyxis sp. CP4 TaxID=2724527 RepID=UPI0015A3394C|nr:hypothetical protein [Parasphingopyxis sp. CP4]QLC22579.1 hypothetical protein HFP51_10570 [Parasphingopyxis sp. CP4]